MAQQECIVKRDALQKIRGSGFILGALLLALGGFTKLSADDLKLYASHPNPAADYADAMQRIEARRATEVDFDPGSHTILLTHGARTAKAIIFVHGYGSSPAPFKEIAGLFYDRGYNVLVAPLPYHGLADRMTTQHARLRAEDLVSYTDEVVDIGRGLGDHLTLAGISAGGLAAGWAAQQRRDVDQAVLMSPGFGFAAIPEPFTALASWAVRFLPNSYIWEDEEKKADSPREHSYPRMSTRALGELLRLGLATQALARQKAPAAGSILVITNLNDHDVDNAVTGKVVGMWRAHGAADVRAYQFPADLHLGHDIIDVTDPNMNVAAVYPKLLELIDR